MYVYVCIFYITYIILVGPFCPNSPNIYIYIYIYILQLLDAIIVTGTGAAPYVLDPYSHTHTSLSYILTEGGLYVLIVYCLLYSLILRG